MTSLENKITLSQAQNAYWEGLYQECISLLSPLQLENGSFYLMRKQLDTYLCLCKLNRTEESILELRLLKNEWRLDIEKVIIAADIFFELADGAATLEILKDIKSEDQDCIKQAELLKFLIAAGKDGPSVPEVIELFKRSQSLNSILTRTLKLMINRTKTSEDISCILDSLAVLKSRFQNVNSQEVIDDYITKAEAKRMVL